MHVPNAFLLVVCQDSNTNLRNLQVVDISIRVELVHMCRQMLVCCLGHNMCTYYIINVLYINSWLTS